jgi:hypothetical protein
LGKEGGVAKLIGGAVRYCVPCSLIFVRKLAASLENDHGEQMTIAGGDEEIAFFAWRRPDRRGVRIDPARRIFQRTVLAGDVRDSVSEAGRGTPTVAAKHTTEHPHVTASCDDYEFTDGI